MASVSCDSNGTKRILFVDGDGLRRTIRLGKVTTKAAESFRLRVETLLADKLTNRPWDAELSAWIRDLPEKMHDRLHRVGLLDERTPAGSPLLGNVLERFTKSARVKPATVIVYKQTTTMLLAHFGEDCRIKTITPAKAEDWCKAIGEPDDNGWKLAPATVSKRIRVAKAIFAKAVRWGLIHSNPFADMRCGTQTNPDRQHYVPRETVARVMEACPDDEWRAIIALCRFAGVRCPSEIVNLRWGDVNWERGRLAVRSPKTEAHEGHAFRIVPMAPEVRPILERLFHAAPVGSELVVPSLGDARTNLRTMFLRILARAGVAPYPRPFQNMRASCATDWVERFPNHVAAGWLGHSPLVAAQHYLQTRDAHFDLATGITP
jgi:integrase